VGRTDRAERGQALVELALTLPVLLLCASIIVTLSLAGIAQLAVENAASEGARAIALTNDEQYARETIASTSAPLSPATLEVRFDPREEADRPRGALVTVRVRYSLQLPFSFLGTATIEGIAARRMEYVP
jgi:Flp pilus assembly protein TadG